MRADLVGTSRAHLLEALGASPHPLSSHDLAATCGLHVTTVRFHLEILHESGLIEAHTKRQGRGRPRVLYSLASPPAVADTSARQGDPIQLQPPPPEGSSQKGGQVGQETDYRDLAMMMAAGWDDTPAERTARARQAGRVAARPASGPPEPPPVDPALGPTVAEAAATISEEFADRGFSPEMSQEGSTTVITLRSCPFQAVAQAHPEVVCSLHLGLLQGTWEHLGAPAVRATLHPFVRPGVCLARLTPTPGSDSSVEMAMPSHDAHHRVDKP